MRITIAGLGHLGTITTSCLIESGYNVKPWDPSLSYRNPYPEVGVANLKEPVDVDDAVKDVDVIWITFDTPTPNGVPQVSLVFNWIDEILIHASNGQKVLISSQLPIGSARKLCEKYTNLKFYYSPENLRRGTAVNDFKNQKRIVIGAHGLPSEDISNIFKPFCSNIFWTSLESAEFIKHALNAFLATSIAFANELGEIAIKYGASPGAVEFALKSDERIGSKAYLAYNKGGLGPHLSRDIKYLLDLSPDSPLLNGVNSANKLWENNNKES